MAYRITLAGLILLGFGATRLYAQNPAAPAAPEVAETERVIVTGSNIPTAEEVGPNPVDTYRTEDIQKIGARTATDLTERLPAITGFGVNENIANGGDGRTEVNLRGLFPKETLILVDGRRVAPVGFAMNSSVDLNLIPFALVDHIDILKDGASAIYGSDAIGGVVNIFLKHKFRGLEIEGSYGNTNLGASNDAAQREGYILAGAGDDKTDIVVFAEAYDRAAIFSRDRNISSNADLTPFGGVDNRSGNIVGFFLLRPGLKTPTPHSAPDVTTSPDYVPFSSIPLDERRFNFAALTAAIPEADRQYYYGSFDRELCDKYLQVFADFKIVRTFFNSILAPVPFAPDPFKQADGFTAVSSSGISVPLQNPFNPFTAPSRIIDPNTGADLGPTLLPDGTPVVTGVRYRALEAGPRSYKITTNDYLFDGGLRGSLGELGDYFKNWNFEIGFRYNADDHQAISSGIVSKPGLRDALLDTSPATAFNPFGRNINTQAALSPVLVDTTETGVATLTDESLQLNGDLISLAPGPVSFAAGIEHRKETVNDQPDSLNTTFNSIGGVDLQATRGSRDVWSYFGELRLPVTSPSWHAPGLYSLEVDAAERVEFYSDTNLAEKPKFSIRYQPFDSTLTLRASYTEAFHAPNLSDLAPSAAEGISPEFFDPAKAGPDPNNPNLVTARVLFGGQPNLRPEVAYGWNYGAVWTPKFIPGLTLSLDYYHIDLRDRTAQLNSEFIVFQNYFSGGRLFPGQVIRDANGFITTIRNLTQNISRTITEGLDYEAIYAFDTSLLDHGNFGTITLTLNGNYLSRYVAAINSTDNQHEYAGQATAFAGYLPHTRAYASAFYDLGGFDAGVTVHYIGQGNEDPALTVISDFPPRKIREWTTADVIASFTFHLPSPTPERSVAGYAKDGSKNVSTSEGKDKNQAAGLTAAYGSCGWRTWLDGTALTAGLDNIFDKDPPFGAGEFENGYEEATFDIKGRFYYVSVKKRF